MAERFDGDRGEIRQSGEYLVSLMNDLDPYRWKMEISNSPFLKFLCNKIEFFRTYGNAILNNEIEVSSVLEFAASDKIYLNKDDKYPVLLTEKTKPDDPNTKVYLTRHGAEIAEEVCLELKRSSIHQEIYEKLKKEIRLDKTILRIHEIESKPLNIDYIFKALLPFFRTKPRGKLNGVQRAETTRHIQSLVSEGKLEFKDGKTYCNTN